MLTTIPLIGFSFQGDERRSLYRSAAIIGSDPIEAFGHASPDAGSPSARDALRPLGRVLEGLQHTLAFEAAEAAGLAPHVVQGAVRLTMVTVVAVLVVAVVSAVARSAGVHSAGGSTTALLPLVLGVVLVAGGTDGPMTRSSFASMGAAALVLSLSLLVARDRDMEAGSVGWRESVAVALLGVTAAATHSLVVLAPFVAGGLVAARAVVARQSMSGLRMSRAARRLASLSVGIVVGLGLQWALDTAGCRQIVCFDGSGLVLSGNAAGVVGRRLLSAAPPAGWAHNASLGRSAGFDFGPVDMVANSLLVVLVGVVAVTAVHCGRRAARHETSGDGGDQIRVAAGLGVLGVAVVLPAAVLAGLHARLQQADVVVGEAWSDTLLVQVGWAVLIAAAITVVVAAFLNRAWARAAAVAAIAALLGVGVLMTLLANERLAYIDRRTPLAAVVTEISEFTIIVEPGDVANALRCELIDTYIGAEPDPSEWAGGPQLRTDLDMLMQTRHGWPFCDPTRLVAPALP